MARTREPIILNPPGAAALDCSPLAPPSIRRAHRRRRAPESWPDNCLQRSFLLTPRHEDHDLFDVFGVTPTKPSQESWTLEPVNEQGEDGGWRWSDERDPFSDDSEYSSSGEDTSTAPTTAPSTPPLETTCAYGSEEVPDQALAYCDNIPDDSIPDIILSPPTTPSQPDFHNAYFHQLSRNRFNLCIDSIDPRIAPHIVISPPDFAWQDYYTPAYNGVPYQWPSHLMVPPTVHYATAPAASTAAPALQPIDEWSASHGVIEISDIPADELPTPIPHTHRHRKRVRVTSASHERQNLPALVTALHRHCFRACLSTIVVKVPSLRPIYDAPGWHCPVERPFVWVDPGAALLALLRPLPGLTVLDSPAPFRAPHIALLGPQWPDAPAGDPWAAAANCAPCPQDAGAGAALCVPGVPCVNEAQAHRAGWETPEDAYVAMEEYFEEPAEGGVSPPDSPTVGTPEEGSPEFAPRLLREMRKKWVDEESVQLAIAPESAWCG